MKSYSARDGATSGAIFGLAGAAWFGWAQASPPVGWSIPLAVGSVACLVLMIGCGMLVHRRRQGQTAFAESRVRRLYYLTIAVEVVACLAGAIGLSRTGQQAYIP